MTRRVVESDVCIIGSGISAAMVAERVAEGRSLKIVVVEAGAEQPGARELPALRQRFLDYGESPWPRDHIDGLATAGMQSRSMCVGGMAMHWGGVTPRFAPDDFRQRSLHGVGTDWPISYDDLDPYYQEAEERMGVAGEQGPTDLDPRGKPFPLPMLPLSYNLERLKRWATEAGIPTWSQPSAKLSVARTGEGRGACCRNDTCFPICPTGAKYAPDMTWRKLRASKAIELHPLTLVRRLRLASDGKRIALAEAIRRDGTGDTIEYRARTFVLASGYLWSAYLLLLSTDSKHPNGLANSSGLVGKYLTGHRNVQAFVSLPMKLYPGINEQHSLLTKYFMRAPKTPRYVRHDLRIWESNVGRTARLVNDRGELLLGDALLADWRTRTEQSTARVRSYYDVIPARNSELTLDATIKTPWGDPSPKLTMRDDPVSEELRGYTEDRIKEVFAGLAKAGDGRILRTSSDPFQDHPGGGCRMGEDPRTSVVDSRGRSHDHENLFVVGAPTIVSSSAANGTLTFCALALMSAAEIGGRGKGEGGSGNERG